MNPNAFSPAEIDGVYRAIRERRDMRHFIPTPLAPGQLERFVAAPTRRPASG
jgi:5,6-dimethylbenzimidazole synthase